MTIYTFIEILFFALFFLELGGKHTESRRVALFRFEAFIVFFTLAFRNFDVGADTPVYVWHYIQSAKYPFEEQPIGYELFCSFLRLLSKDWRFYLFITSLISIFPFCYFVKKYASFVTLPFLTFLLCWKQLWVLETPIKQTVAIGLFFGGGILLFNCKQNHHKLLRLVVGLLLLVLSFATHSTMLLTAPIALVLPFIRLNRKIAIISILATILLSSTIILFLPHLFDNFMQYAFAYELFDNIGNYKGVINNDLETLNFNAILWQSIYVLFVIGLSREEDMNNYSAKCLIIAALLHNLFISFPNNARVILYFTVIGSSFCPAYFYTIIKKTKNKLLLFGLVIIMFAFFYLHYKTCLNYVPNYDAYGDVLPYSFWFENSINP